MNAVVNAAPFLRGVGAYLAAIGAAWVFAMILWIVALVRAGR